MASNDEAHSDYFTSYGDINIHALMLKDQPRTLAYKTFMEQNASIFHDKIVIDVGAGTGILSLFAAKAGAKKVYAIEASDIAHVCQSVIDHNSYSDIIELIHDTAEHTEKLDGIEADIIVSEWMGFYLLHESMLDTVLIARDRWLKTGGLMLPGYASLYACPVSMEEYYNDRFEFWNDVYGFDFTPVIPLVVHSSLQEPVITALSPEQLMAEPHSVKTIDLHTVQTTDIQRFRETVEFKICKNGKIHGFACWFDVNFVRKRDNVSNSTCVESKNTERLITSDSCITDQGNCLKDVDCKYIELPLTGDSSVIEKSENSAIINIEADLSDKNVEEGNKAIMNDPELESLTLQKENQLINYELGKCVKKTKIDQEYFNTSEQITDIHRGEIEHEDCDVTSISNCCDASALSKSQVTDHVMSVLECHNIIQPPCSSDLTLSTAPSSRETHWKQTVIMLPSSLLVESGDMIGCSLEMSQSEENKRHYNISIELCEVDPESDDSDTDDHPMPCGCEAPRCRIIRAVMEKYDEQEQQSNDGVIDITGAEIEAVDEGYDDMNVIADS